jgi:hypothetical protein
MAFPHRGQQARITEPERPSHAFPVFWQRQVEIRKLALLESQYLPSAATPMISIGGPLTALSRIVFPIAEALASTLRQRCLIDDRDARRSGIVLQAEVTTVDEPGPHHRGDSQAGDAQ